MEKHHKIQFTAKFNAPVDKVWDALTKPEIIKQYFYDTDLITDWKVGNEINFTGEWEGKRYKDKGIILEYKHNEELAYSYLSSWSGKEDIPENYLWVSYKVKPVDDGTELIISQTNYDEAGAEHTKNSWAGIVEAMKKIIE